MKLLPILGWVVLRVRDFRELDSLRRGDTQLSRLSSRVRSLEYLGRASGVAACQS